MNSYVPILFMLGLGFAFAALSVFTSLVVGPKRYNRAKLEAYAYVWRRGGLEWD